MGAEKYVIDGYIEEGYELVKEAFEKHFQQGLEECAQLCVYVHGEIVIDLWGCELNSKGEKVFEYQADSIQCIFASSRVITSLVVAMLAERMSQKQDLFETKVVDLWPEFAEDESVDQYRKQITVGHLLRYEAGLPFLEKPIDALQLTKENIKNGSISNILGKLTLNYPAGTKRENKANIYGWALNEVVRRIDNKGRTIGEFIQDEVAGPMNLREELLLGVPELQEHHVVPLTSYSYFRIFFQLYLPSFIGGGQTASDSFRERLTFLLVFPFLVLIFTLFPRNDEITIDERAEVDPEFVRTQQLKKRSKTKLIRIYNSSEVRRCECPSSNIHASARAMAKLASMIVQSGKLPENPQLITAEGIKKALSDPTKKNMTRRLGKLAFGSSETSLSTAGWRYYGDERFDYIGYHANEGSAMLWHEEESIGFGYAMNCIERLSDGGSKSKTLQKIVLECTKKRNMSNLAKLERQHSEMINRML